MATIGLTDNECRRIQVTSTVSMTAACRPCVCLPCWCQSWHCCGDGDVQQRCFHLLVFSFCFLGTVAMRSLWQLCWFDWLMSCRNNVLSLPDSALLSRESFLTFDGRASRSRFASRMGARFSNFSTGLIKLTCQWFVNSLSILLSIRRIAGSTWTKSHWHLWAAKRKIHQEDSLCPFVAAALLYAHERRARTFELFPKKKYWNIMSLQL